MKKIKIFLIGNIKTVVAFILGIMISGTTVIAATVIASSQVSYTNNSQETVQGALDDLYTKANNMVPIDSDTFQTNKHKTIYASSKGVCIKRNDKLNCFKINNWEEEQNHLQQVFSDVSCRVESSYVSCQAFDFYCGVLSNGDVRCIDEQSYTSCFVYVDDDDISCS